MLTEDEMILVVDAVKVWRSQGMNLLADAIEKLIESYDLNQKHRDLESEPQ